MHMIKKIVSIGQSSRGVILPKSWLKFYEKKHGRKILNVGMELNSKIVIWPILKDLE